MQLRSWAGRFAEQRISPPSSPLPGESLSNWLPSQHAQAGRTNWRGNRYYSWLSATERKKFLLQYFVLHWHVCFTKWTRNTAPKSRSEGHSCFRCTMGWRGKRKVGGHFVVERRSGLPVSGQYVEKQLANHRSYETVVSLDHALYLPKDLWPNTPRFLLSN